MVSYRFLRPDDLPLIADSINRCYNIHYPGTPDLDLDGLKKEAKEINIWASSCMVAMENKDPIAILAGAKREGRTLIRRLGVRPDFRNRGHGTHLLKSLSSKLAIVGPPEIIVEIPKSERLLEFFQRVDYRPDAELADWILDTLPDPVPKNEAIQLAPVESILPYPDLWRPEPGAWDRAFETISNRKDRLQTYVLASSERVEAFIVFDPLPSGADIWRIGFADPERGPLLVLLLIRRLTMSVGLPIHIPRLQGKEFPAPFLERIGFQKRAEYLKLRTTAGSFQ